MPRYQNRVTTLDRIFLVHTILKKKTRSRQCTCVETVIHNRHLNRVRPYGVRSAVIVSSTKCVHADHMSIRHNDTKSCKWFLYSFLNLTDTCYIFFKYIRNRSHPVPIYHDSAHNSCY